MGEVINGYEVIGELSSANAGFSQWGFCRKGGREYFIKTFLSPRYPPDDPELSARIVERKKKICEEFYRSKREFYDVLSKCRTGNNILVEDFFRWETRYYIVTDKVSADGTDPAMISALQREKKEALLRAILFSVSRLHEAGLVHADLKPDNILLKRTADGYYTAKIIDFDAGFLVGKDPDDLQFDPKYSAPETFRRNQKEDVLLDEKIDIFALGILFHQYWTGEMPKLSGERKCVFEAVLNDEPVWLSRSLPADLKAQIARMLSKDPADRPGARELLDFYLEKDQPRINPNKIPDSAPERTPAPTPDSEPPKSRVKKSLGFYVPQDLD